MDSCFPRFTLLALLSFALSCPAGQDINATERMFAQPPGGARPWVYWFWISGNISSNGITADLEAMKQAGLGGVLLMEVDTGAPAGQVSFGSPGWRNLFEFACREAHRLGLKINLNNDAGWSGSGGPWITPELSMKKLVWTETLAQGPALFGGTLTQPEAVSNYYRDIAVLAVPGPKPPGVVKGVTNVTISPAPLTGSWTNLVDGDESSSTTFTVPTMQKPLQIDLIFAKACEASCLKLGFELGEYQTCFGELSASSDGQEFRLIRQIAVQASGQTYNFAKTSARVYRLVLRHADPFMSNLKIREIELSGEFLLEDVLGKAAFIRKNSYPGPNDFRMPAAYAEAPPDQVTPSSGILDLTSKMDRTGRLRWQAPPGEWRVLRFGYTTTGKNNHPAPEAGRGLECDKLSKAGAEAMFRHWLDPMIERVNRVAPGTLTTVHIDSWEVGSQNWTQDFREEFRRRRGYDLLEFLPVITGKVIDSVEVSERFLWDFRQTAGDLLLENYAGHFRKLARRAGVGLSIEAYDGNPCEDVSYGGRADEPMAEFWSWYPYGTSYGCLEMASAAHVYGKRIVSAEAFTATDAERWRGHPYRVKIFGDWAYCKGVNRFVFHRYAMQPWIGAGLAPGMSMGPFGLHYERTQTWWGHSGEWHDYLARCQYLLQQGEFAADFSYLVPEMSPQRWRPPQDGYAITGFQFDACPSEMVLKDMSVDEGRLVLSSGANYRLLALPDHACMTPALLRRIRSLVKAGATIIGPPPQKSPSLSGYPACDQEVARLSRELWGDNLTSYLVCDRRVGQGRVVAGRSPQQFLFDEGIAPDFKAATPEGTETFRYIHKSTAEMDFYFVSNPNLRPIEANCAFRISGRPPEFWWPDSGQVERPAVFGLEKDRVTLPLRLEPAGSVFVIFRKTASMPINPIASITRRDERILDATRSSEKPTVNPRYPAGTNTFTFGAWVYPAVDTPLLSETNSGIHGYNLDRNDALFPPPGYEVFDDYRTACPGLSVGRNGVIVFECSNDYFVPIVVLPFPVTNWTHIAVSYESGEPALYLNGRLARRGPKSNRVVHAPLGLTHRHGAGPFRGQLGSFQQFDRALTPDEMLLWVRTNAAPRLAATFPALQVRQDNGQRLNASVFEAGTYELRTADGKTLQLRVDDLPPPIELSGRWELTFPKTPGAEVRLSMDRLMSWTDHAESDLRHFSGTATYRRVVQVPPELLGPDRRLFIDLGRVEVMAVVTWNGKRFPALWKPPFRVELTDYVRSGENEVQVEVVNLWINRLIGDEALPEDTERNPDGSLRSWPEWLQQGQPAPSGRSSFTTWKLWKASDPLEPSGLLGPVQLVPAQVWSGVPD